MAEKKRVVRRKPKSPGVSAAKKPRKSIKKKKAAPEIKIEREEQRIEESKYYASPVIQKFIEEKHFEFPAGYGDNRIVALVRDPFWLYVYWEINEKRRGEIRDEIGADAFSSAREFLRIYDTESWDSFDIEITGGAKTWYVHVPAPNRTYCVDVGFKTMDGRFIAAARSNWVTTPLDRMSDVIDEQWMIPDWDRMYALSGGFGIGRGSEEIRELMQKRFLEESASGWIFSASSPMHQPGARPFWLVANCELVVYGATEPTATVIVQSRKIPLREDGTFSLRFSLPDGKQVIPIEAIRDDGQERRKITPVVERKTE